ncbi:MAG: phytanoyl-CoA dioxygenase family protein [Hyphomicrobiaceae bacterium]
MNDQATAAPTRAEHQARMADYLKAGEARARDLGNKGPVRFDADGNLHPDIVAAYWKHGFYIFEGVISPDEVAALRADALNMLERAPAAPGGQLDTQGRPAMGRDWAREPFTFIKPLSDPWGGTDKLNGRHPSKMAEAKADSDAPEHVVFLMYGMCMGMPAGLRVYGHPHLLAIAAAINGSDFVPFNDAIFVKQPGVGGSVAWHQDGVTHWNAPDWDEGIHGFNFQVQLFPTTAANCLWVVPGSHKLGKIDIKRRIAENGGDDRLPEAVPLICNAGDVTMVNRQCLHGSFANSSPDIRISLTFGFHRRRSVLGAKAGLSMTQQNVVYDEQRIFERAAVIPIAVDARHQHYPAEVPYKYHPFADRAFEFRYTPETRDRWIKDYNTKDLAI